MYSAENRTSHDGCVEHIFCDYINNCYCGGLDYVSLFVNSNTASAPMLHHLASPRSRSSFGLYPNPNLDCGSNPNTNPALMSTLTLGWANQRHCSVGTTVLYSIVLHLFTTSPTMPTRAEVRHVTSSYSSSESHDFQTFRTLIFSYPGVSYPWRL